MKRAVFPGSFDPVTIGHQDIVNRGLKIFDEIIIGVGENIDKKYMFSSNERLILYLKHLKLIQRFSLRLMMGLQ